MTQLAVLYREVSLIQRQICAQIYVVETADSVLIRVVSFIQVSFIERFRCTQLCMRGAGLPYPECSVCIAHRDSTEYG